MHRKRLPVITILLTSALASLPVAVQAQTAQAFTIVSIRPHHGGGDSSDRKILPGGRFVGSNVNVRTMMRIAFSPADHTGGDSWVDSETYDMDAKVEGVDGILPEQLPQLMFSLLQDRFGLQFHRVIKDAPVYWLDVAKNGPKLKASQSAGQPLMSTNFLGADGTLTASRVTMSGLAGALQRQTGRPVRDRTGLSGEYELTLRWSRDETADSASASIFTALQEQLGLKLTAGKGPIESVVMDHVERPSEN